MSDALQLDKRQRAMLAEMGVRVWTPIQAVAPLREASESLALTNVVQAATTNVSEKALETNNAGPLKTQATKSHSTTAHKAAVEVLASVAVKSPSFEVNTQTANNLDWPSLREAITNCQACGLCTSRRNTVFGTGSHASNAHANANANAEIQSVDWLIVGEAPGENEDAEGEPFVGQAGQLLDNMLRAMQLSRTGELSSASKSQQSIFITNVLKCRPPGNRNPAPEEVAQCMPYLQRQITLLQPKIILAMGRFAAQALLRDSIDKVDTIPLGKLRGQVHRLGNTPVVVTYHPAYVLRNLPEKAKLWADACLAMATLNHP
jgi:DNA polymerase